MKLISLVLFSACSASLAFAAGSANNLILVSDQSKSGNSAVSLDFVSDGQASAIEARIDVSASKKTRVDTSKCAVSVPKTHQSSCVFNGKQVVVLVYSMTNANLPVGVLDLGTISVFGADNNKGFTVGTLIAGAANGLAVPAITTIDGKNDIAGSIQQ